MSGDAFSNNHRLEISKLSPQTQSWCACLKGGRGKGKGGAGGSRGWREGKISLLALNSRFDIILTLILFKYLVGINSGIYFNFF